MKRTGKEVCIRLLLLLAGLTVAHFGVTLFLLAELGADPFNVLVQGVYRTLAGLTGWPFLTHGRTHVALCLLIIVILLRVDRRYVKAGTLVCMVCGGPIIDFFTRLLSSLSSPSFAARVLMVALGCVILALGMTLVIKSDAGTGPNDLVAVVLSDKLHRRFSTVRIVTDAAFVLAGFLLGGAVGLGTVVCVVLVGPAAGLFLPWSEGLVARVLRFMNVL